MNQTKLLSSNPDILDLLFESEQFSEVLSPVVQPQAIIDEQQIDHLLIQIGFHSNRLASLSELRTHRHQPRWRNGRRASFRC
jgi:hypothetical protein